MERNDGISSLFNQLLKAKRLPMGDHIAGCTNELRELMEFVDTLVERKQTDNKMQILDWKKKYIESNNNYNKLNANFQIKESQMKDLNAKIKNSSEQQIDIEKGFNRLKSELDDLKKRHEDHRKKCSREIKTLRSDRTKLKEHLKLQSSNSESYKLKIDDYKTSLQDIGNLNKAYQDEIDEIKIKSTNKIEKLNNLVAHQEEQVKSAEQELLQKSAEMEVILKDARLQAVAAVAASTTKCNGKMCEYAVANEKYTAELEALHCRYADSAKRSEELRGTLGIRNNEIDFYKKDCDNTTFEINELNNTISTLKAQLRQMKIAQNENNLSDLQLQLNKYELQNKKYKNENCRLIEELNELTWKIEEIQTAKVENTFYDGESIISEAGQFDKTELLSRNNFLEENQRLSQFLQHQKPEHRTRPQSDVDETTFDTTIVHQPNYDVTGDATTNITCYDVTADDVTADDITAVDYDNKNNVTSPSTLCTSERALAELRLASTINDYETRISLLKQQLSDKGEITVNDDDLTIVSATPSENFMRKLDKICDYNESQTFSISEIENSVDRIVDMSNHRSDDSIKWLEGLVDERVSQHMSDLQLAI